MLINIDNREPIFDFGGDVYITIPYQVYQKIQMWVEHFKTEISGCGLVSRVVHEDKSVQYIIEEVFLPPEQKNTAASTDIDAAMVHKLVTKLVKAGKDTEKLKLHWHSHAAMDVFHSGTDRDNYKDLNNGSWLVSLVMNHAGKVLGGLHLYGEYSLDVKGVPVYVWVPESAPDISAQKDIEELEQYAEKNKSQLPAYYYGGFGDYDRESGYDFDFGSKFDWDSKKQRYVPKKVKKDKFTAGVLDVPKVVEVDRRELLGSSYNAVFETCDGLEGAPHKCATCLNEVACTKYWSENWA